MIVYGKNVFNQLANDPASVEKVYILKGIRDKSVLEEVKQLEIPYELVERSQLDKLTKDSTHNGVAAKVKDIPTCTLDQLLAKKHNEKGFYLALDGIQDPHNLGAILRTADCAGVDGVLIPKHNSAGLTPVAVKASTGAAFTVPVAIVTNMSQALKQMKEAGYWVAGTDMANARDYREGMYEEPTVLVIGSEGKGISPLVKKQCDYMVSLPMAGTVTSLNASVAAGILMYQVNQKREAHAGKHQ